MHSKYLIRIITFYVLNISDIFVFQFSFKGVFTFSYTNGTLDENRGKNIESVHSTNPDQGMKIGLSFLVAGFAMLVFGIITLFVLSRVF